MYSKRNRLFFFKKIIILIILFSGLKTKAQFIDVSELPSNSCATICGGSRTLRGIKIFKIEGQNAGGLPSDLTAFITNSTGIVTKVKVSAYSLDNGATWTTGNLSITGTYNQSNVVVEIQAPAGLTDGIYSLAFGVFNGAPKNPFRCASGNTNNVTITSPPTGVPSLTGNEYGDGKWIAQTYNYTPVNNVITAANRGSEKFFEPANYLGYFTKSAIDFNLDYKNPSIFPGTQGTHYDVTNLCPKSTNYAIRFQRTNFPPGEYTFYVNADDGERLSIDGGATWIADDFIEKAYNVAGEKTSPKVCLTGNEKVVYEYFQHPAASQISIRHDYNPSTLSISAPSDQTICNPPNATFSVSPNPAGTYNYKWEQSADGTTYTALSNGGIYAGVNTAALSITGATAAMNGYKYRAVLTGTGCTSSGTSAAATLNISSSSSIGTEPHNASVCAGSDTSFTVKAIGSVTYQWQVMVPGGNFANVTNSAPYSGATTPTLKITGAIAAMNGNQYRVIVTGCSAVTSNKVTLTVLPPVAITQDPTSAAVCPGSNAAFTVAATGTNPTYQWQEEIGGVFTNVSSSGVYSGSTTDKLTLTNIPAGMNGRKYKVIVSGCGASPVSSIVDVTVQAPPSVTNPSDQQVCPGGNASFTVTGAGTGIQYRWQEDKNTGTFADLSDGGIYSNTDKATLNLTGINAGMTGYKYRVIVSGTCPSPVTSAEAELISPSLPSISQHPANVAICETDDATFSVTTPAGLNYQWQVDKNDGSGFKNITGSALYSGEKTAILNINSATAVMNNYQYKCIVSGCSTDVLSNTAKLTVNIAPVITVPPGPQVVCAGNNTFFSVTAKGATSFQWQEKTTSSASFNNISNTAPYSVSSTATGATLNITGSAGTMNANEYKVIAKGACPTDKESTPVKLTVNIPPSITADPTDQPVCPGSPAQFSVTASGSGTLQYKWQVNKNDGNGFQDITSGVPYSGITTDMLSISASTNQMDQYTHQCIVTGLCGSKTSNTAILTINSSPSIITHPSPKTICEGETTSFSVTANAGNWNYQWKKKNNAGIFVSLTDDVTYIGTDTKDLTIKKAAIPLNNSEYMVLVTGCNQEAPSNTALLKINPLPLITLNPVDEIACDGRTIFFAGDAINVVSFEWQVKSSGSSTYTTIGNDGFHSGTNKDTLFINANKSLSGNTYQLIATGTCGKDTSLAGEITVNQKPEYINHPESVTICEGESVSMDVTVTGDAQYQWQVSTDNAVSFKNLANDENIVGANQPHLTIEKTESNEFNLVYRCVISGCDSLEPSDTAIVHLKPKPLIYIPNSFTPNNDQHNDTFKVTASGIATFEGSIHNRWGEKIFAWNDKDGSWDGTLSNSKASIDDVYVYLIKTSPECKGNGNSPETIEGIVHLIK